MFRKIGEDNVLERLLGIKRTFLVQQIHLMKVYGSCSLSLRIDRHAAAAQVSTLLRHEARICSCRLNRKISHPQDRLGRVILMESPDAGYTLMAAWIIQALNRS